ncbi:YtjB family periplasmic protein [Idiomarina sp. HP20-50]|uniref:YtjB family periplasmic protein n=1 Tax=Idiomarina sp. HP20-50 TaxID=3070813 RepID=UPI00294B14E1|nr:AhpA/YtjB family protein [Idiomarina sp. HP20-50]MDV6317132.1 AhpA/YtjB family protein [Idiomarina sp. HP20-50]
MTKRALRLAAAGGLLLIIINVWNIASVQSQQQLFSQTQSVTQLMMEQAEHEAYYWLEHQNTERLTALTEHLAGQPEILSATIRNRFGELLVHSGVSSSIIDWPEAKNSSDPWVLIEEISRDSNVSGYLQVVFDKNLLLKQSQTAHEGLMQQGKFLLLLAMLAGVFIMLGFNRIRDRYWQTENH